MNTKSRLLSVFAGMCALLLVSIVGIYMMGRVVLRMSQQIALRETYISDLSSFLSTMKDAETGQRGYLLTIEDSYLLPYENALARVHDQINILKGLADRGELPADSVAEIEKLSNQKLAELGQTITLTKQQQHDAAIRLVRTNVGKDLMDDIRGKVGELIAQQQKELGDARQYAETLTKLQIWIFLGTVVVNLVFLAWAYDRIKSEMAGRRSASLEVERQKDLLAVTLASIGDAVIVTDTASRITFINEIAAKLTGWPIAQAKGQPCANVFKIINEETRKTVESPVDKVLEKGVIVGLANHTLLIRKDGSEIPIDDSGAPVREADGTVRGVVLVFRDFSEHKQTERNLRQAKAEVEAASRAKDQFLAALSHELRTPLTPVLATLTGWEASDQLPASLLADVQMLRRNLELEARLIDDLLDLTRISKGKLRLNPELADVHELLEAVTGMYHSDLIGKKIKLTIQLGADRHHVNADPARLQQVFWNILKNAVKFTPEEGAISISSTNDADGNVTISFTDNGIGMAAELLQRLFKPFEQGGESTTKQYGGLGLGMAISKALMDAQHGSISASSAGADRGSTFSVTLPAIYAPALVASPNRAKSAKTPQRRMRILLVEDHADTAEALRHLLAGLGHEVEVGRSVAKAAAMLRERQYDLLLSDIGLPDGTGLDLVRALRQQHDHKIPAVALTGFGMDEDISKCMEAGFNEHLTKPVSFQRLEMLIRRFAAENS